MLNFYCVNPSARTWCNVRGGRYDVRFTTLSARCCDKDFLSNTDIGQLRIQRIFQAPDCLKLDYKYPYPLTRYNPALHPFSQHALRMSVSYVVLFLLCVVARCYASGNVSLDSFPVPDDTQEFKIITVNGPHIFAVTEEFLFRLEPDLKEKERRIFAHTRLFVASNTRAPAPAVEDVVFICGIDCYLLNATDFTTLWSTDSSTQPSRVFDASTEERFITFTGVVHRVDNSADRFVLTYTQNVFFDRLRRVYVASKIVRGLIIRGGGTEGPDRFATVASQTEMDPSQGREFIHVFTRHGFTYFISVMSFPSGLEARIARVCNMGSENTTEFTSYIELALHCGDGSGEPTAATFIRAPNAFDADAIVLSVRNTRLSEVRNGLCAFNLTRINELMAKKIGNCANGKGMIGLSRNEESRIHCELLQVREK